jgi:hypothetical protein
MLADALRISGQHALGDCQRARDSGQQQAERPHPINGPGSFPHRRYPTRLSKSKGKNQSRDFFILNPGPQPLMNLSQIYHRQNGGAKFTTNHFVYKVPKNPNKKPA